MNSSDRQDSLRLARRLVSIAALAGLLLVIRYAQVTIYSGQDQLANLGLFLAAGTLFGMIAGSLAVEGVKGLVRHLVAPATCTARR